MLSFLRKYQKIFYAIIIVIIAVSFSFFGTERAIQSGGKKLKDKTLFVSENNRKIKRSEVERLSYFLSSDIYDSYSFKTHVYPNYFNDGVIRFDFIQSKLAKDLFDSYFEEMKENLQNQFNKTESFRPFVHAHSSKISAENAYQEINPEINKKLKALQARKELSKKYCHSLIELFNVQQKAPQDLLRQILIYKEKNTPNLPYDMRLYQDSLALFGFETTQDWVGKDFIDIASQYIIYVAELAKKEGYKIDRLEILTGLKNNLQKALGSEKDFEKNKELYFAKQLSFLGLDEKQLTDIWEKVLLFRKYINANAQKLLVDKSSFADILKISDQKARIALYLLPKHFAWKSKEDLLEGMIYFDAIFQSSYPMIEMNYRSMEEIIAGFPELAEKRAILKVAKVNLEELGLKIPLKEMWSWQTEDENYQKLRKQFPFLAKANEKDKRLQLIDNLAIDMKEKLDKYSRKQILLANFGQIKSSLAVAEIKEIPFSCRQKNPTINLAGIKDPLLFQEQLLKNNKLLGYTQDDLNYYNIELEKMANEYSIVSFTDAQNDRTLQNLRKKIFGNEVTEAKITEKYKNVLARVESFNNTSNKDLNWHARNFFSEYMRNYLAALKKDARLLDTIANDLKLESKKLEIGHGNQKSWIENEVFKMDKSNWSSLHLFADETPKFYCLEEIVNIDTDKTVLQEARNALADENSYLFSRKIFAKIVQNKKIVVPIRKHDSQ